MRWVEAILPRRRKDPRFSNLPSRKRKRLTLVCQHLTKAEDETARKLGLATPPRLIVVDEEEAVILFAQDRAGTF